MFVKDFMDEYTGFDVGLAAGLVLKLKKDKGMSIGIRNNQGFINVMKTVPGHQQNSGLSAYVSFTVGAAKKEKSH